MKEINKQSNLLINYTEKTLQGNVIDKTEFESLCNILTKFVDENKNESVL